MSSKKKTEEYDGPTLNGHPLLSATDVQAWFKKAGCDVPAEAVLPMTGMLNEYEFLGGTWKNYPALRRQRRNDPSRLRAARVAVALQTLQKDFPIMIEEARAATLPGRLDTLLPATEFRDQVNTWAVRFQRHLPSRGRERDLWHVVARKIAAQIIEIFRVSGGGRRIGFGKPTSPAVGILRCAFAYLEMEVTPEAIVDALRPKRKRVGK
jgi:hypothetical protein